jgi:hypothetical protein
MTLRRNMLLAILITSATISMFTFYLLTRGGSRHTSNPVYIHSIRKTNQHRMINIPYFNDGFTHSSFRCVGDNNDISKFDSRSCVWTNVCYDAKKKNFNYYQRMPRPLLFDKNKGPIFTFKPNGKGFVSLNRALFGLRPFSPDIVYQKPPDESQVHRLKDVHVVWRHSSKEHSFGHLIFEDFATIHYSFTRLGTSRENAVLMHSTGLPDDEKFKRIESEYRKAITPKPAVSLHPYLVSFGKQYVCFNYLQASSPVMPFDPASHAWNHGKEDLFYSFRNDIILSHGLDPEYIPGQHKIIVTNKKRSNLSRRRHIANLNEVVTFIRKKYPTILVEVVEWDSLPAKEQIMKALSCTILITPCGGVSFIMPFLPHGAYAIAMDYYSGPKSNDNWRGILANQSISMEGSYWNHYWHFKTLYYQVFHPSDYKWDVPRVDNYRQYTSVIVKEAKIVALIDTALEGMERQ